MSLLCYWVVVLGGDTLFRVDVDILCLGRNASDRRLKGAIVIATIRQLLFEDRGQDVAEYAVMLAVILVIVIGTVRLIGGNANNVFSQVQSQMSN